MRREELHRLVNAHGEHFAYVLALEAHGQRLGVEARTAARLKVIDSLRRYPHPTHPHLAMTLEGLAKVGHPRAIITHMDNTMDYDDLAAELPPGVEPGYDGLEVQL